MPNDIYFALGASIAPAFFLWIVRWLRFFGLDLRPAPPSLGIASMDCRSLSVHPLALATMFIVGAVGPMFVVMLLLVKNWDSPTILILTGAWLTMLFGVAAFSVMYRYQGIGLSEYYEELSEDDEAEDDVHV